jgi:hypothetical protein
MLRLLRNFDALSRLLDVLRPTRLGSRLSLSTSFILLTWLITGLIWTLQDTVLISDMMSKETRSLEVQPYRLLPKLIHAARRSDATLTVSSTVKCC